jgi:NADPH:quinone reductase-like Zn-dependent oxidoreductase
MATAPPGTCSPGSRWHPLGRQRIALADTVSHAAERQSLVTLTGLIEEGKVTPVIGRTCPFHDIQDAVRYQEQGHAPGKVVVTI